MEPHKCSIIFWMHHRHEWTSTTSCPNLQSVTCPGSTVHDPSTYPPPHLPHLPHSCLLSLRACLSLASKAALVSMSSSSCRRMRAMSSWEVSHCSLRAAESSLSCVAAMESCSLRSRHCSCILLASLRRDSTLTATDSHWFSDMFWDRDGGQRSEQTLGGSLSFSLGIQGPLSRVLVWFGTEWKLSCQKIRWSESIARSEESSTDQQV